MRSWTPAVLLILDGLDEVPDAARGQAVAAINEALRPGEKAIRVLPHVRVRCSGPPADGPGRDDARTAVIELAPSIARWSVNTCAIPADRWLRSGGPRLRLFLAFSHQQRRR